MLRCPTAPQLNASVATSGGFPPRLRFWVFGGANWTRQVRRAGNVDGLRRVASYLIDTDGDGHR